METGTGHVFFLFFCSILLSFGWGFDLCGARIEATIWVLICNEKKKKLDWCSDGIMRFETTGLLTVEVKIPSLSLHLPLFIFFFCIFFFM